MLEKINLSKKMSKKECKALMEQLEPQLSLLQRRLKEYKVPVVILFEGFGASGKGTMINELIQPMDPRGFKVFFHSKSNGGGRNASLSVAVLDTSSGKRPDSFV